MNMMEIKAIAEKEYTRWRENIGEQEEYYEELLALEENEEERVDSFYTHLTFGTSGMRGLLGPGPNRINARVIRRASQGLANFLKCRTQSLKVVVSYDSRKGSHYYAKETACVLNGNGIEVFLFDELTPVSVLSYAIGKLDCIAGVMITASHNPKRYNGYKVYNEFGHQITGNHPKEILAEIEKIDFFDSEIRYREEGIHGLDGSIREAFVCDCCSVSSHLSPDILNQVRTVYTPLNGTGNRFVREVFSGIGYDNYEIVHAQEFPNEEFPTCPQPNPEKILAFNEAFRLIDESEGDLIIATDPDADRIGMALYHEGMRTLLTGNQLGLLILDFLCRTRAPKKGQLLFKSIATTPLAETIATSYGLEVRNTLPGFKYVGEELARLEQEGRLASFFFAFEESNGYLLDSFVREKDGISGSMIALEMASDLKQQGKNPVIRLKELYEEYGACLDRTRNFFFQGAQGKAQMDALMEDLRNDVPTHFGELAVIRMTDYRQDGPLPKSNILQFDLDDGSRILVRPSGTEPKLKVYTFERGDITSVERDFVQRVEAFRHLTF